MTANRSPGHETCHHATYYLTCDQYEQLLAHANGHCQWCGTKATDLAGGKLHIDHDGPLGFTAVRGLLCPRCNVRVMNVETGRVPMDDRTADYLSRPWHVEVGCHRPKVGTRTVVRRVRVSDDLWAEFGAACAAMGRDRTAVIRDAIGWAIGEPGAKRPVRPASRAVVLAARQAAEGADR